MPCITYLTKLFYKYRLILVKTFLFSTTYSIFLWEDTYIYSRTLPPKSDVWFVTCMVCEHALHTSGLGTSSLPAFPFASGIKLSAQPNSLLPSPGSQSREPCAAIKWHTHQWFLVQAIKTKGCVTATSQWLQEVLWTSNKIFIATLNSVK